MILSSYFDSLFAAYIDEMSASKSLWQEGS